ncbi:hypothetical protein LUZ60_013503 [Juncus effusus]|nr:hypothetical protein LUZ60_013503 [Juncus effusus]
MEMTRITTLPSTCYMSSRPHVISPALSTRKTLSISSSRWRATGVASRRFRVLTRCSTTPTLADLQTKAAEIDLKGTSIFLVGMRSFMKFSAGRVLAEALKYCFLDSDSVVEEAFGGESAVKSACQSDEQGFRDSETEVLKQLSSMGRLVVSAGHSAVLSKTNLGLLRYGITIWVDVPIEVVAYEYPETLSSPEALPQVVSRLSMTYQELKGGCGTADATVSLQRVANQKGLLIELVRPEDMAMEILVQVEKLMRVKKMMEAAAKPF